jgi:hypothetical protein
MAGRRHCCSTILPERSFSAAEPARDASRGNSPVSCCRPAESRRSGRGGAAKSRPAGVTYCIAVFAGHLNGTHATVPSTDCRAAFTMNGKGTAIFQGAGRLRTWRPASAGDTQADRGNDLNEAQGQSDSVYSHSPTKHKRSPEYSSLVRISILT